MAQITNAINKGFFDSILPTIGNPRVKTPTWDEDNKMFIFDDYESKSGNYYYKGIRFSERIAVVEKIGLYHNWTYIDGIEIYAFNGTKPELVQKRDYQVTYRNEEFVRKETEEMLQNYLKGAKKTQACTISDEQLKERTSELVEECYKSFLESDYNIRLTQIIKQIEQ